MAKIRPKLAEMEPLEGGGAGGSGGGSGVGGTKWSSLPSFKGNANTIGDLKKLTKDTSHLKGGAKESADAAKSRAAKRTAVRAVGVAGVGAAGKAATDAAEPTKKIAEDTDETNFKQVERILREVDAEKESRKYGEGDKMKSGGSVKGWGKARGARTAKNY